MVDILYGVKRRCCREQLEHGICFEISTAMRAAEKLAPCVIAPDEPGIEHGWISGTSWLNQRNATLTRSLYIPNNLRIATAWSKIFVWPRLPDLSRRQVKKKTQPFHRSHLVQRQRGNLVLCKSASLRLPAVLILNNLAELI